MKNYASPFKFLSPFEKEDSAMYFGRNDKINELYNLLKKSGLIVLYGPSGSGKTSLIKCGLANRDTGFNIINLRRGDHFVKSFFHILSNEKVLNNEHSLRLSSLFNIQYDFKIQYEELDEEITELHKKLEEAEDNYDQDEFETLNHKIDGKYDDREQLEKKIDELENQNTKYLKSLNTQISKNLVFVFDQFEELFISGNQEEIQITAYLIKYLQKSVKNINIIISIRSDFFGELQQLENTIDSIYFTKCRLDHPTYELCFDIVYQSFKYLNINEYELDANNNIISIISEKEKQSRIKLILSKIIQVNEFDAKIFLPFLQIYLDRIYVADFLRTYNVEYSKLLVEKDLNELVSENPIEIEPHEVESFGNIENILEKYLIEINDDIKEKSSFISGSSHDYTAIKFLRYFVTTEGTRNTSIEVENIEGGLALKDEVHVKALTKKIWGEYSLNYKEALSDIIDKLSEARIIQTSIENNKIFLIISHDTLASVIKNRLSIPEDYIDILKRLFNSQFSLYHQEDIQDKSFHLLSPNQFAKIEDHKEEIIGDEKQIDFAKRLIYWNNCEENAKASLKLAEDQLKKMTNKNNQQKILLSILGVAMIILSITYYSFHEKDKDLIIETENVKILNNVFKNMSDVIGQMNLDNTQSLISLNDIEILLDSIKDKQLNIVDTIKNHKTNFEISLFKNVIEYPTYKKELVLKDKGNNNFYFSKLKVKKMEMEGLKHLFLFMLDKNNDLYYSKIRLDSERLKITPILVSSGVHEFEPIFNNKTNDLSVLISSNNGDLSIYKMKNNEFAKQLLKTRLRGIEIIEQLDENRFLMSYKEIVWRVTLDWENASIKRISNRIKLPSILKSIKKTTSEDALILTSNNFIYKYQDLKDSIENNYIATSPFKQSKSEREVINYIEFDSLNNNVFYSAKDTLYKFSITLDSLIEKEKLNDDDITAFDFFEGAKAFGYSNREIGVELGSYYGNKILKGHTALIQHLTFIDKFTLLSASEDGTIKIWDFQPFETAKNDILSPTVEFTKIDFDSTRNSFLVSYDTEDQSLMNQIIQINDSLDILSKFYQIKKRPNEITSFDFNSSGNIYLGMLHGRTISPGLDESELKFNRRYTLYHKKIDKIFDIAVDNNNVYMATDLGVYFDEYPFNNDTKPQVLIDSIGPITTIEINKKNSHLVIGTMNGEILLYNMRKCKFIEVPKNHLDRIQDICFSESGKYMISGGNDNAILMWQIKNDTVTLISEILNSHYSDIKDIDIYKDSLCVSVSVDKTGNLFLFDTSSSKEPKLKRISSIINHTATIGACSFTEDGKYVITGDNLGILKKWDIENFSRDIYNRIVKSDN